MQPGTIRIEYRDRVAVMILDRPERRNAFNEEMWHALGRAVDELKAKMPRAVVITGAGDRAFSAGFDVNPDNPQVAGLVAAVQSGNKAPVEKLISAIRGTVDALVSLPVPLIAAINGIAYGGGAELAVRCDLRVQDPNAIICFSEVTLGLMPDWGGGVALARLVGASKAADLVLTARKVTAAEALAMGLVNRVSDPGGALENALGIAAAIAENGPRAVRAALGVIRKGADVPLAQALEMESDAAASLVATGECVHGIAAFISKKPREFPDA